MFEQIFRKELLLYTVNKSLAGEYWSEIEIHYNSKKRHYHTLTHLDNLAAELLPIKNEVQDWATIVFSIAYHDIIYNALKTDNEEQSARFAERKLKEIGFPPLQMEKCLAQILATKSHQTANDTDTNLFTDADLSVLGADNERYILYTRQIRKEYSFFPDFLYKPGRKKVLSHFLTMDRIFKTDYFHGKYEMQARKNISLELASLT